MFKNSHHVSREFVKSVELRLHNERQLGFCMDPSKSLSDQLNRWIQADLIDADVADAIQRWEDSQIQQSKHASVRHLAGPIRLSILLGSLLLAAGLLLFVSAHWDQMPPSSRVSLLLFIVIALHAGGAWFSERFQLMSIGLHAVGTVALGAGVFLCAQIFHLDVFWSFRWGLLLWSVGAAAGWMHYLAFDFWVGAWILRDSQSRQIAHLWIVFPLLCTFMLGPVGVLLYATIRFIHDRKK